MSKTIRNEPYRKFSRFMFSAIAGHGRVGVTILVYSAFALLLLAYVSVQIYAGMLRQEIAALEKQRLDSREALNKLTGRYVSVSSRARVAEFCEAELGMVRIGGKDFEVVAVGDDLDQTSPVEFTTSPEAIPSGQRYTARHSDENLGQ